MYFSSFTSTLKLKTHSQLFLSLISITHGWRFVHSQSLFAPKGMLCNSLLVLAEVVTDILFRP